MPFEYAFKLNFNKLPLGVDKYPDVGGRNEPPDKYPDCYFPILSHKIGCFSANIKPLNDDDMESYIIKELESVRMGVNTFNEGAMELIIRSAQGNLRLCRNLCYGSLIDAARAAQKTVTITHVNSVLVQPHWRTHEELIKQQVS